MNLTLQQLQEQGMLSDGPQSAGKPPQSMTLQQLQESGMMGQPAAPSGPQMYQGVMLRDKPAPDDPSQMTMGKAAGLAARDVKDTAMWGVDFVLGGVTAALGGAHAVSQMAYDALHPERQVDVGHAVKQLEGWSQYTPSEIAIKLGIPENWVRGWVTKELDKIPHGISTAADDITEFVREGANLNPSTAAGMKTALEVGAYALTFGLVKKGNKAIDNMAEGTPQAKGGAPKEFDPNMPETENAISAAIGRKPKPKLDKDGIPEANRLTDVVQEGKPPVPKETYTTMPRGENVGPIPEPTPQVFRSGRDLKYSADPNVSRPVRNEKYDPTLPWEETPWDKATKAEMTRADLVDPQIHLPEVAFPLDFPRKPELPPIEEAPKKKRGRPKKKKPVEMKLAQDGRQAVLDFEKDTFFERGQELVDTPGFLRNAEDLIASKHFERRTNEMAKGTDSVRTRRQGGASNFGFSQWLVDTVKKIFKGNKAPKALPPISPRRNWDPVDYNKLTQDEKLVVPDVRPLENLMSEIVKDDTPRTNKQGFTSRNPVSTWFGKQIKDIGQFGKNIVPEFQMVHMYRSNPVVKWGIDNLNEIARKWDRLAEMVREGESFHRGMGITALRNFKRDEAGPIGYVDSLPENSKAKVYNMRVFFDEAQVLKDQGLMWPTDAMLKAKGMNAAEIKGYKGLAKMTDELYDVINYARGILGKKPVRRIPGYFPHLYEGNWVFKVLAPKVVGGVTTMHPVFFTRAPTKLAATRMKAKLEKMAARDPKLRQLLDQSEFTEPYRMEHPNDNASMMAAFEEALGVYDGNHWATPVLQKVFHQLKGNISEGVLTHALERSGVPGSIGKDMGLGKVDSAKLKEVQERYVKAVMEFAKRAEIIAKVEQPLSQYRKRISEDMGLKNTVDYLDSSIALYKGDPKNHLKRLDDGIEGAFDFAVKALTVGKQGFSGHSVHNSLQWMRNYFTTKALGFYRGSYLLGNALQPHYVGLPVLMSEASRLGKGDPYKAAALMDLNTADVSWFKKADAETLAVIDWGMRNKVITPSLFENVDFGIGTVKMSKADKAKRIITGRGMAEYIEKMGRMKAFVASYRFYRSADMSRTAARDAAVTATDHIMMNYEKYHRPRMYTDFGIIGETMSPFAVFGHGIISNTALSIKAIAHNKGSANKVKPMVAHLSTQLFFGGALGIMGIAEIELLIKGLNTLLEWSGSDYKIPSVTKALLEMGANDLITFGAVSAASKAVTDHGVNVGSLFRAPASDDFVSAAGFEWWWSDLMGKGAPAMWKIFSGEGTEADVATLVSSLAPNATAGLQEMWWSRHESEGRDGKKAVRDVNRRLGGKYMRSKEEWITRALTGSRSLSEERAVMADRAMKDATRKETRIRTHVVEQAADYLEKGEAIPNEVINRAIKKGIFPLQLQKRAQREMKRRMLGVRERRPMGNTPQQTLKELMLEDLTAGQK